MLLNDKRRIAQIEDKEEKLAQMLSKIKPEDREKVKEAIEKTRKPMQKQLTSANKIQPRKKVPRLTQLG